jgi:hypothetical protein
LTLALLLTVFSAVEMAGKTRVVPPTFMAGSLTLLAAHLSYWWWFLNRFEDHRAVVANWSVAWLYRPVTFVPALIIVGSLAAVRLLDPPGLAAALKDSRVRLFAVWFLVVFALAEHNLIAKPVQPIHFTHGYDWMALFFLSAPLLVRAVERLLEIRNRLFRNAAVGLLVVFFLLDNIVWLGSFLQFPSPVAQEINLTPDQASVLGWLSRNAAPPALVVCEDNRVSYLVSTYTRVRSWAGHDYNTPAFRQRSREVAATFHGGSILPQWERTRVYYVAFRASNWVQPPGAVEAYQNGRFIVWDSH